MRIGELAAEAEVSTKTIRYYESLGLVAEPDRTASGYRDYAPSDIERLRFIRDAQATGLTLSEIASVLELKSSGERSCSHTLQLLERHLEDVDTQIERLKASKVLLQELAERAAELDPANCTDPNRCQIISTTDG